MRFLISRRSVASVIVRTLCSTEYLHELGYKGTTFHTGTQFLPEISFYSSAASLPGQPTPDQESTQLHSIYSSHCVVGLPVMFWLVPIVVCSQTLSNAEQSDHCPYIVTSLHDLQVNHRAFQSPFASNHVTSPRV